MKKIRHLRKTFKMACKICGCPLFYDEIMCPDCGWKVKEVKDE